SVDDRVNDVAFVEHDVDRPGEADEEAGEGHRFEAVDEGVGGAGDAESAEEAGEDTDEEEQRRELVEFPVEALDAVDVDGEGGDDREQDDRVAPARSAVVVGVVTDRGGAGAGCVPHGAPDPEAEGWQKKGQAKAEA